MPSCSRRTISAILQCTLSPTQPVDHMDALAFQRPRPFDVALFVEARFQLHQHRHLLAVFDRLQQRLHDGRIPPHPIKRHLDGEHIRIVGRFLQQIHHRLERLIRMMQQPVFVADHRKHVFVGMTPKSPAASRARRARRSAPAGRATEAAAGASDRAARARGSLHRASTSRFSTRIPRMSIGNRSSPSAAAPVCGSAAATLPLPRTPADRRSPVPEWQLRHRASHGTDAIPQSRVPGNSASQVGRDHLFDPHKFDVAGGSFVPSCASGPPAPPPAAAAAPEPSGAQNASARRVSCRTIARFRLRFEMCGNGRPGSKASGVSTGKIVSV